MCGSTPELAVVVGATGAVGSRVVSRLVRGHVVQVDHEDWGIGERPAAQARAAEIRDRATLGSGPDGGVR